MTEDSLNLISILKQTFPPVLECRGLFYILGQHYFSVWIRLTEALNVQNTRASENWSRYHLGRGRWPGVREQLERDQGLLSHLLPKGYWTGTEVMISPLYTTPCYHMTHATHTWTCSISPTSSTRTFELTLFATPFLFSFDCCEFWWFV